ncbi:hypothetical protein ACTHPH_18605 [Paenibacillus pasadenensis]|uniref:Uncharacterized protein n=1 Tax=Paenibacillus pasadenensis TaxID=217090 RepID=A0A2N5N6J9_9BACL|nr:MULTISPECIES: hypothetical protein [Paenibacillus]PLT45945.1 hypothetical protein B8V81_4376 [Paenibacillus pasadenensis]
MSYFKDFLSVFRKSDSSNGFFWKKTKLFGVKAKLNRVPGERRLC